jgi:hypothetical protein
VSAFRLANPVLRHSSENFIPGSHNKTAWKYEPRRLNKRRLNFQRNYNEQFKFFDFAFAANGESRIIPTSQVESVQYGGAPTVNAPVDHPAN